MLSKHELKETFDIDEFGFSFQTMSKKCMHFKGKKCPDEKQSKIMLTGLGGGNAVVDKLLMIIIRTKRLFNNVL